MDISFATMRRLEDLGKTDALPVRVCPTLPILPALCPSVAQSSLDFLICAQCKSESLTIWITIAPKVGGMWFYKDFWHNRLQCKSYQRLAPMPCDMYVQRVDANGNAARIFHIDYGIFLSQKAEGDDCIDV